ncbi:uncharacterized protein LOC116288154 [Actinia tenebrosa]|uniref:Uncharacterized protein LOC116288154 n=1 Tax=Actinia tenebrosa TaxID=6105 RepID=A0A6P8H5Q7_ACTTE|nr:uncharacterized protein LOC116288154 [Actinia tenebrosa]
MNHSWCEIMLVVWYSVVLLLLHQPGDITASLRWPGGIYGLPKPKSGCPEEWGKNRWEENGAMYQKTTQGRTSNDKSNDLHLAGYVKPREVKINFCISKTNPAGRQPWPKGEYCIYSRHRIRSMVWGFIRMYDVGSKTSASNTCSNTFFEVKWYHYNRKSYLYSVHFKCQTRGNKKIPISLPITKPFYLLPYGSRDC